MRAPASAAVLAKARQGRPYGGGRLLDDLAPVLKSARTVRAAGIPSNYPAAVGFLRRMAWNLDAPHGRPGTLGCLKETV